MKLIFKNYAYYLGVTLHHCSYESIGRAPNDKNLLEFKEFYEVSRADKPLTLREIFCNMLICQRGLSTGMAWAITEKYPTLANLKRAYDKCNNEKEKENLIAGNFFIYILGRKDQGFLDNVDIINNIIQFFPRIHIYYIQVS